ncbi:MAG TPA: hypothetical protein VI916_05470 [Acidimicrobiia bacterium]|nr:hypothetical protein [Acidimicrobiia bacterium]
MSARAITAERSARRRTLAPQDRRDGRVRVVVGDGFPLLVEGLVTMLPRSARDLEVVGFSCSGGELERLVRAQRPTVAVLGDRLPCLADVPFPMLVQRCARHTRTVVLGSHLMDPANFDVEDEAPYSEHGVATVGPAGAVGYVKRDGELGDLIAVIRLAARGYATFPFASE